MTPLALLARAHVARELAKLGRQPQERTGVVTNGLFAIRPANLLLLGTAEGVRTIR